MLILNHHPSPYKRKIKLVPCENCGKMHDEYYAHVPNLYNEYLCCSSECAKALFDSLKYEIFGVPENKNA